MLKSRKFLKTVKFERFNHCRDVALVRGETYYLTLWHGDQYPYRSTMIAGSLATCLRAFRRLNERLIEQHLKKFVNV